ncbi:hypothetical protein D1872_265890 [compost metagenome]
MADSSSAVEIEPRNCRKIYTAIMSVPRYMTMAAQRVLNSSSALIIWKVATCVVTLGMSVASRKAVSITFLPRKLKRSRM